MNIRNSKLRIKYFFDKILSLIALIFLSPLFFIIGVILKTQGQDVFYLQKRFGYLGKNFNVYKFTTMPKGSEKLGIITTINDERPFRFGKFLRRTSLNEIPQLINVLKGEMSFVGPRPLVQINDFLDQDKIKLYYRMRPGITGLSSVYFHNEDEILAGVSDPYQYYRDVIIKDKINFENEYYQNWSFSFDLKLLFQTIIKVVFS